MALASADPVHFQAMLASFASQGLFLFVYQLANMSKLTDHRNKAVYCIMHSKLRRAPLLTTPSNPLGMGPPLTRG